MNNRHNGFTMVELIIVIVVTGILAAIVIVGWSGVMVGARDQARAQDAREWAATFDTYKGRYLSWPLIPTAAGPSYTKSACLGTPVASDGKTALAKCVEYGGGSTVSIATSSTDSQSIVTEVAKIGSIPINNGPATNNKATGPFVYLWRYDQPTGDVEVFAAFVGFFEKTTCPTSDSFIPVSSVAATYPRDTASITGLTNLTANMSTYGITPCALVKKYTYNPN